MGEIAVGVCGGRNFSAASEHSRADVEDVEGWEAEAVGYSSVS